MLFEFTSKEIARPLVPSGPLPGMAGHAGGAVRSGVVVVVVVVVMVVFVDVSVLMNDHSRRNFVGTRPVLRARRAFAPTSPHL